MQLNRIYLLLILILLFSCKKENVTSDTPGTDIPESGWLVPISEVTNSQHAMDFIPSIDDPVFAQINNTTDLKNEDLVLVFQDGDIVKIYPHKILQHHEIVNDKIDDNYYAITYCPLTGSGLNWNRRINGEITEFGVSGMLYRSNLIPYDRNTTSFWSQMLNKCVNGEEIKKEPDVLPLIEMHYETAKKAYPNALVLQYDQNNYNNKARKSHLTFRPKKQNHKNINDDYPLSERMPGVIIRENVVLFRYADFTDQVSVIQGYFNKREIIIAGSHSGHFAVAFINTTSNPLLKFTAISGELPVIMSDNTGNRWDMFGNAVDGPMKGEKLDMANSYIAYYWGWLNFFPDLIIAEN